MNAPRKGFGRDLLVVLASVLIAAGFLVFCLSLSGSLPALGGTYDVKAVLPTSGALTSGARVTMAGAEVGSVKSVKRQGVGAVIEVEIRDESVTPLPEDSQLTIRQHTPVGENYVAIVRGKAKTMLARGDTIPISRATDEYVDVDQVLSVLSGDSREHARKLIQGGGAALDGRGRDLNDLLRGTSDAFVSGSALTASLHRDRRQISRLVAQLGDVTSALGERDESIRVLARSGSSTFRALAARDDALRATLDELPSTVTQVRRTTRTLDTATGTAAPVLFNLAAAARDLRPALRTLRPAAGEGRRVVGELGRAAEPLTTTVRELRELSGPTIDALPELRGALCEANPILRNLQPYTRDTIAGVHGLSSASNSYDSLGHLIRITAFVNDNTLVGLPKDVSIATQKLLHTGLLSGVTGPLNWNPYPEPGKVGRDGASGKENISGPEEYRSAGGRYPRIYADC